MSIKGAGLPESHEMAGLFGYVTDEDRERWERSRERNKKDVSSIKGMLSSSMQASRELSQQGIQAKLMGEQQAMSRDNRTRSLTRKRTITETVDFEPRDTRTPIDEVEMDF